MRILVLVTFLLLISCGKSTEKNTIQQQLTITDLQGNKIDLDDLKGKVVFLNFWATWCGPCIKEMPSIKRASEQLSPGEVEFLLASDEDISRIKLFAGENDFGLPIVHMEPSEELNLQALPTTVILDKSGNVAFREIGMRMWDTAENVDLIKKIISKQ